MVKSSYHFVAICLRTSNAVLFLHPSWFILLVTVPSIYCIDLHRGCFTPLSLYTFFSAHSPFLKLSPEINPVHCCSSSYYSCLKPISSHSTLLVNLFLTRGVHFLDRALSCAESRLQWALELWCMPCSSFLWHPIQVSILLSIRHKVPQRNQPSASYNSPLFASVLYQRQSCVL